MQILFLQHNSVMQHVFNLLLCICVYSNGFRLMANHRSRLQSTFMALDTENNLLPQTAQIPLKVAICGGGVGGMFLGYALYKKGFEVKVFEKTAQFSRFGGPIQLASNALSCVKAIDPLLFDKIMGRFTFTGTRIVSDSYKSHNDSVISDVVEISI